MLKAGFRKCHRRPQHRLPLGCELRFARNNTNPPHLPRIPPKCRDNGNCTVCSGVHDPASCQTRFTRGRVQELKNGHNSVTVQNRTHVYINFFHQKGLGNHILQLCPEVVKHPVYCWRLKELCSKLVFWKVYAMMHGQRNIKLDGTFKPHKHQWKLRTLTNTADSTIHIFHFIFSYLHNRPEFQYSFSLKHHKRINAEIHGFLPLYIIQ